MLQTANNDRAQRIRVEPRTRCSPSLSTSVMADDAHGRRAPSDGAVVAPSHGTLTARMCPIAISRAGNHAGGSGGSKVLSRAGAFAANRRARAARLRPARAQAPPGATVVVHPDSSLAGRDERALGGRESRVEGAVLTDRLRRSSRVHRHCRATRLRVRCVCMFTSLGAAAARQYARANECAC